MDTQVKEWGLFAPWGVHVMIVASLALTGVQCGFKAVPSLTVRLGKVYGMDPSFLPKSPGTSKGTVVVSRALPEAINS